MWPIPTTYYSYYTSLLTLYTGHFNLFSSFFKKKEITQLLCVKFFADFIIMKILKY